MNGNSHQSFFPFQNYIALLGGAVFARTTQIEKNILRERLSIKEVRYNIDVTPCVQWCKQSYFITISHMIDCHQLQCILMVSGP